MNARERFIRTINRQRSDRPALFATLTPQVAEKIAAHLGMEYEPPLDSLLSTRISHTKLLLALGNDAVGIAACAPDDAPTHTGEDGLITNEWGMTFINKGLYNEFFRFPLENAHERSDIDDFPFPDPHAPGRFDDAIWKVAQYKGEYGIIADLETSIFETAWYLVGMEKLLVDLIMEPPYLEPLLDRIMEINTEIGKELIRIGADLIWCGDDFGTQTGMIMDPETWRRLFKPRIRFMFEQFREVNPDIRIAWHSCGAIRDIVPDFIELGLDFLNPLQPMAAGMEPEGLVGDFGNNIGFFGGICVQDLLPNGTPEQIRSEVRRRAEILGKHDAYIIAPAHNIQDDTPVENIIAFFDSVKDLSN